MAIDSDLDLSHMLGEAGVLVVFNGESTYGILDLSDSYEALDQGGQVISRRASLLVATGALTNLRDRGRITVDGIPYVIGGHPQREDDGKLTRCPLVPVP